MYWDTAAGVMPNFSAASFWLIPFLTNSLAKSALIMGKVYQIAFSHGSFILNQHYLLTIVNINTIKTKISIIKNKKRQPILQPRGCPRNPFLSFAKRKSP
jgi:hypothetical protein